MARYFFVSTDPADLVLKGGPIQWDGLSEFAPPDGTRLITEAEARSGGYTPPGRRATEVNEEAINSRLRQLLAQTRTWLAATASTTPSAAQVTAQTRRNAQIASVMAAIADRQLDDPDVGA